MTIINSRGIAVSEISERACRDYEARFNAERAKALAKYGEEAVTTKDGRPDVDVLDYLITELVGLNRYGEMLEARCAKILLQAKTGKKDDQQRAIVNACKRGIAAARQVFASGGRLAHDIIEVRLGLLDAGVALGRPQPPWTPREGGALPERRFLPPIIPDPLSKESRRALTEHLRKEKQKIIDRRTPGTPEMMNAELTGEER